MVAFRCKKTFAEVSIWHKALGFNWNYWAKEERSNHLVMARYTPNFDKEEWKYLGLEILGAEFEWDKIK